MTMTKMVCDQMKKVKNLKTLNKHDSKDSIWSIKKLWVTFDL